MRTRDVLRAAVRNLREHGWTQGYWTAPSGCHCAVGAVYAVKADERCTSKAITKLAKGTPRNEKVTLGDPEMRVIWWNDMPGRTKNEVLQQFRRFT
jgi:hypothetical protein